MKETSDCLKTDAVKSLTRQRRSEIINQTKKKKSGKEEVIGSIRIQQRQEKTGSLHKLRD